MLDVETVLYLCYIFANLIQYICIKRFKYIKEKSPNITKMNFKYIDFQLLFIFYFNTY